jgi:hypothetical protein
MRKVIGLYAKNPKLSLKKTKEYLEEVNDHIVSEVSIFFEENSKELLDLTKDLDYESLSSIFEWLNRTILLLNPLEIDLD